MKVQSVNTKQKFKGTVVRISGNHTVKVSYERQMRHPEYQKLIRKTRFFLAHDPENRCRVGDAVEIISSRPISKHKCWVVSSIVGEEQ